MANGDDKKPQQKPAAFDRFVGLAGEWVGKMDGHEGGKDVTVSYKVTSNGTTVVETMGAGTPHEMVTLIHPDGDDILLTHYCAIGNQPTMKAPGASDGNKVEFKFLRATNMKSDKDMHMHDVTYTFVDKDTLQADWTNFDNGKAAEHAVFELKRKK
jgi:hypothetical protein